MKHFGTLLKVAATVALFVFIFSRVDIKELASKLAPGDIALALVCGAGVLSVQAVIIAVRLAICVRMFGYRIDTTSSWIACQYSGFFSHTPISFVGGDAMRVWYLTRSGVPMHDAAKSVIIDRALGFMGMMVLVAATVPAFYFVIKDPAMWGGLLVLATIGFGATVTFLALGRLRFPGHRTGILARVAEYSTVSRQLILHPRESAQAFGLAVLMNLLNPLAIWLMARAYDDSISLYAAAVASPIVFLISMIPISVAGWGVREGAFVVVFGLFGASAATSLTVSISFGVAFLLAYIPGAVLFLLRRRSGSRRTAVPAEGPGGALGGLDR